MPGTTVTDPVEALRALKGEISARYRARAIGIFGSFARGEHGPESDIDLLVDFEERADILDLTGLTQFLEQKLGRRVDVVPRRALREELSASILKEVIPL